MDRAFTSFLLSIALAAPGLPALAQEQKASPPAQQQPSSPQPAKPSAADLKEHETKPGDRYEPSLDVLKQAPVEAPEASRECRNSLRMNSSTPSKSTSSGAPAVTACCVTAPPARR